MPSDIFLEYLLDSACSMPIFLDEEMLSDLENSWRWRHVAPGSFEEADGDDFILDWTRDILTEPDVLGIEDTEFSKRLALAIKSEKFLADIRAMNQQCSPQDFRDRTPFGLGYVLLSGKLGDPEDFLDMNILPNLDAVRILYEDWTMKKREITSSSQLSLNDMPFYDLMDGVQSADIKQRATVEHFTDVKRRKRASSFKASSIPQTSSSAKELNYKPCDFQALQQRDGDMDSTQTSPQVMDESEMQMLMRLLDETLERVGDSEKVKALSYSEDQYQYSQNDVFVLPGLAQSFISAPSLSSYHAPTLSRSSSVSFSSIASSSSCSTLLSSCSSTSSIFSLSSSPSMASVTFCTGNNTSAKSQFSEEHGVYNSAEKIFASNSNYLDPFYTILE